MANSAVKNKRAAMHGLYFVLLMHPVAAWVFWSWIGGIPTQLMFKIVVMDVAFYMVRRSEPSSSAGGTGTVGNVNVCEDCQVSRAPRTMHCKTCKKCILKWDHHCPLINGCVGAGNHGKYVFFLVASTVCLFSVSDVIFAGLPRPFFSFSNILPVALMLVTVTFQATAAGLLTWHIYLVISNQTSPEVLHPEKCFWLPSSPTAHPASAVSNIASWANSEFCGLQQQPSPPPSPRTWSSSIV